MADDTEGARMSEFRHQQEKFELEARKRNSRLFWIIGMIALSLGALFYGMNTASKIAPDHVRQSLASQPKI